MLDSLLMQGRLRLDHAGLQVLRFNDLGTFGSLNASKDHGFINATRDRDVTIVALLDVQSKRVGFLPKLLIVKRFEPFIDVFSVFKVLHGFIVPNLMPNPQGNSSKGYTRWL